MTTELLRWIHGEAALALAARGFAALDPYLANVAELTGPWERPIERAVVAGLLADRLGFAFAAGYREALRALVPDLSPALPAVLCATEEAGAHPRAIRTTLRRSGAGWVVDGHKRWSTLADRAEVLLIIASEGEQDGRPSLRLVQVVADAPGLSVEPMPQTPFAPEIGHFEVHLDQVHVPAGAVWPDDAWTRYLRPFRTVEDLHVTAAALGWLLGVARQSNWPKPLRAEASHLIAAALAAAERDWLAPESEIVAEGLLRGFHRWLAACEPHWEAVDPALRGRWERDRPLLDVASGVRQKRLEAALLRCAED